MILFVISKCICLWIALHETTRKAHHDWWMNITFFIYAMHLNIERVESTTLRVAFARLIPHFRLTELVVFALSTYLTLVTCILCAYLWKRLSPKTLSPFTGNRE